MKQAQDIMTRHPRSIQSGEEMANCLQFFLVNEVHYAPVVSPVGEVLGLMSEFALVKASLRHYLDPAQHEKVYAHRDILEPALTCFPNDTIEEVVRMMIKSPTHRVLVIDNQKKLVGIISPKDILHLLSGQEKKVRDIKKDLEVAHQQAESMNKKVQTLEESIALYQELLDNAPQMIHGVNEQGKIVLANAKLHETLGYKRNELLGQDLTALYPKSVYHEAIEGLKKLKDTNAELHTYSSMIKEDGSKIRVDMASSVLRDKYGKFMHTITISREVDSEALLRALHGVLSKPSEK